MEKFEIVKAYNDFEKRIDDLEKVINPLFLSEKIKKLEQEMLSTSFWNDNDNASLIINELNDAKEKINSLNEVKQALAEIRDVLEFDDVELFAEVEEPILKLNNTLEKFEVNLLLNGEYDQNNAIMELHPGAGGTESQDWALMLYRMYRRFAERKGFTFELLDYQEALDAGIKSATFLVKGKNAYGYLKSEHGVHRLVRISPFDSNARRHTSFAACSVIPEMDDRIEIKIADDDIKIDTYRVSGAGGQHVNRTDSAIRITHIPTGIVVTCQNERSQIQNKARAMSVLKAKLFQLEQKEKEKKLQSITGSLDDNAFGSQIRSYVLHPYAMVKDHRTLAESSNPASVLDGDLDKFINAYLKYNAEHQKEVRNAK